MYVRNLERNNGRNNWQRFSLIIARHKQGNGFCGTTLNSAHLLKRHFILQMKIPNLITQEWTRISNIIWYFDPVDVEPFKIVLLWHKVLTVMFPMHQC